MDLILVWMSCVHVQDLLCHRGNLIIGILGLIRGPALTFVLSDCCHKFMSETGQSLSASPFYPFYSDSLSK